MLSLTLHGMCNSYLLLIEILGIICPGFRKGLEIFYIAQVTQEYQDDKSIEREILRRGN